MTTRYRVEYALKSHRRDQFIEFIKGLLAGPFVLHVQLTAIFEAGEDDVTRMATMAHRRYAEIMLGVEELVNDHINHQKVDKADRSKLKLLIPTVGTFFTPLLLHDAFVYQDSRRHISSRRFVAPSFNDVRVILNTAQVMSLVRNGPLELVTFDGDVTLYNDGESLMYDDPAVSRLIRLLKKGVRVGIVTAAGYTEAKKYYGRLYGLLERIHAEAELPLPLKNNLIVMGGESNYLFRYSHDAPHKLEAVLREEWALEQMREWKEEDINELLQIAERALSDCVKIMHLPAHILRKERAVGIVPAENCKLTREQLEETVLVTQKTLEASLVSHRLPFCAFNGGNDVFVDIGDKSLGVIACQRFFGGIDGSKTLHVGDQFLSAGANDFKVCDTDMELSDSKSGLLTGNKARLACTTAWIASPTETVALLDELAELELAEAERLKAAGEGEGGDGMESAE